MSVKVSVIIPVYNAEKYIGACMESLLSQTQKACEYIFVNDGSTDRSKQIIDQYQKRDSRIKLIDQDNQGVSIARNNGLKLASGEYVGFVDADDYIDQDMFETLYAAAKQGDCDVVISNFEREMEGHKAIIHFPFSLHTVLGKSYIDNEILPYYLKTDNLNAVWNKIYKNEVIRENQVIFPDRLALGEDGMFNIQFLSHAQTVKYIDYAGYHYREAMGSATRNISEKDYFKRAMEVYHLEPTEIYRAKIDPGRINKLKAIKLMDSVISYIHIYFGPTKDLSFSKRYKYVKNMISHPYVRESLPVYCKEYYDNLGRYEKMIVKLIHNKSTIGLYCAATYSRLRNIQGGL